MTTAVLYGAMMVPVQTSTAQTEEWLSASKRCLFSPPPNYSLTTDEDDPTQLTDGIRHSGEIWLHRGVVGWGGVPLPTVTIDLGEVRALGKVNFYAAGGGVAEVFFPAATALLLSEDGKAYEVAALVAWPGVEPSGQAAEVREFQLDAKHKRGRFVQLAFQPHGRFLFLDEIEVLADRLTEQRLGEYQALSTQESSTPPSWILWEWAGIRPQLQRLADKDEGALNQITSLDRRITDLDLSPGPAGESLLQQAFAMRGQLARKHYGRDWMGWSTPPWVELRGSTFAAPDQKPATTIDLRLWQNEYESAALSIGNFSSSPRKFSVQISPLRDSTGKPYDWAERLWLREALFIPTWQGPRLADPLPLISDSRAGAAQFEIGTGAVKILWLTLRSIGLPEGEYAATVEIWPQDNVSDRQRLRLTLRVDPLGMPQTKEVSLTSEQWVYRWGYNLPEQVESDLEGHYANSRIFHPVCLPLPQVDPSKTVLESIDFRAYDRALEEAGPLRIHSVFWGGGAPILDQFDLESEAGQACFKQWIAAWADHLAKRGIGFQNYFFYPYDEEIHEKFVLIARLIKEVDSRLQIFCNEVGRRATGELIARIAPFIDIWCPCYRAYRQPDPDWKLPPENKEALEAARQKYPSKLWIYACDGPAKNLSPDEYYRKLPWLAFSQGAAGAGFWAYADTRGDSLWDDMDGNGPDFSVIYLAQDAPQGVYRGEPIIPSRRWEAWREGVEDYQYLQELQGTIHTARKAGVKEASLLPAERVLQRCLQDVMKESTPPDRYNRARESLTEAILCLRRIIGRQDHR